MSVAGDAEARARLETEGSPGVFFVLCEDGNRTALLGTLYAVQLPSSDLSRFRLWEDADGFDVFSSCAAGGIAWTRYGGNSSASTLTPRRTVRSQS